MQPTIAIDLPLKLLVWESLDDRLWISSLAGSLRVLLTCCASRQSYDVKRNIATRRTYMPCCDRRNFLKSLSWATSALVIGNSSGQQSQGMPRTANGGTEPYPIPWLDKNGSHNQPAGPDLEPSHIYHFKGRVARCSTFTGMGTDNQGNRIAFGSPTTDYGVMQGEYWAGRTTQDGAFAHI